MSTNITENTVLFGDHSLFMTVPASILKTEKNLSSLYVRLVYNNGESGYRSKCKKETKKQEN